MMKPYGLMKDYIETLNIHSTASVEQIRNEILKIESAKLEYTYKHFEELKSILNEQQKSRFGLIIKDITIILIGEEREHPVLRGIRKRNHVYS